MTFIRTQIYLDPDDHRALVEEAEKRGTSLTGLLREIVGLWLARDEPPRGFDAIIGIVDGEPTDIATKGREYMDEAMKHLYERKVRGTR